jgi:hypothetical protein
MAKQSKTLSANKYGPVLKAGKAEEFAMEVIYPASRREKAAGRKGIPICSWGEPGIGKTELPNSLVKKYKDFFGGNIVYLPMAQIEEKAELQGLPELQSTKRPLRTTNYKLVKAKANSNGEFVSEVVEGKANVKYTRAAKTTPTEDLSDISYPKNRFITYNGQYVISAKNGTKEALYLCIPEELDGSQTIMEEHIDGKLSKYVVDARTIYATPSWIPQVSTHGEKGLLVIDDMNRADERIINSIMQLLQDGALLGWRLPEKWEIFCTCNPEGGEYMVTSLDGAQMTRMANYEQRFDKDTWLEDWAIPTGVHPIAQNFVMTNPQVVVQGERTNPRSFDKFFRLIHNLLDKVKISGDTMDINSTGEGGKLAKQINDFGLMNIGETPLQSFISFLTCGYGKLPGVDEILSPKFDLKKFFAQIKEGNNLRVDILSTINTRLTLHVKNNVEEVLGDKSKIEGIKKWCKAKDIPMDIRYNLVDQVLSKLPEVADEELAEIIFAREASRY